MHDLIASQLCRLFMMHIWSRDYLTCLWTANNTGSDYISISYRLKITLCRWKCQLKLTSCQWFTYHLSSCISVREMSHQGTGCRLTGLLVNSS